MAFVSESLYIVRFVPPYGCKCGAEDWGRTTAFHTPPSKQCWVGHTFCMACHERTDWLLNPDLPLELQANPAQGWND